MRARDALLFLALLLFAPTLVLAGGLGTIPIGAWLVSAAGWRLHRTEATSALIIGVEVLAWAGAWWLVARRLSRRIRRAPQERWARRAVAAVVVIAAVGVLPIYGWAAPAGFFPMGWFQSAYHVYAEVVFDVLGYR